MCYKCSICTEVISHGTPQQRHKLTGPGGQTLREVPVCSRCSLDLSEGIPYKTLVKTMAYRHAKPYHPYRDGPIIKVLPPVKVMPEPKPYIGVVPDPYENKAVKNGRVLAVGNFQLIAVRTVLKNASVGKSSRVKLTKKGDDGKKIIKMIPFIRQGADRYQVGDQENLNLTEATRVIAEMAL